MIYDFNCLKDNTSCLAIISTTAYNDFITINNYSSFLLIELGLYHEKNTNIPISTINII